MSLFDKIPVNERITMENYINKYGITQEHFIGLENWLVDWAICKKKLCKMLGGNLIYEFPIKVEKNKEIFKQEIVDLLAKHHKTIDNISDSLHIISIPESKFYIGDQKTRRDIFNFFYYLIEDSTLIEDKSEISIKIKFGNKTFQAQKGSRPMRTLCKFVKYLIECGINEELTKFANNDNHFGDIKISTDAIEAFRIGHSLVLNDKYISGTGCLSVHPFDFITMSDNSLNWRSCMNWTEEEGAGGCYRIGSVEMMNSNNVIIAYLKGSEDFLFDTKHTEDPANYTWNNKRFRQLFYVTKDIIVGGVSYPFKLDSLTMLFLNKLRELAQINVNWGYQYGPELYKDMKHITGMHSMSRAKEFIANGITTKHNIIFDSNGMYNDMLNKNNYPYYCVRNKVKKNKVICYSGKAHCLCCNKSTLTWNDDEGWYDSNEAYNGKYTDTRRLVCEDCISTFTCDYCCNVKTNSKFFEVNGKHLCEGCFNEYSFKCKCCGKNFYNRELVHSGNIEDAIPVIDVGMNLQDISNRIEYDKARLFYNQFRRLSRRYVAEYAEDFEKSYKVIPLVMCPQCIQKHKSDFKTVIIKKLNDDTRWLLNDSYMFLIAKDPAEMAKYSITQGLETI